MQHLQQTISILDQNQYRGGRVNSAKHRSAIELCEDFSGLEENVNRYDLLLLVKRVGKSAGFTPRMIQLLDYYMAFTRDIDWEEGSRPIVYQSLARTALDLGISERQIQKLEKQLFDIGAITWNDSGNHKRYGQRDAATGQILYAYGVDLTPLAYLKPILEEKLHEKKLYDRAWLETKRQISWYRRQICSLILEQKQEEGACDREVYSWELRYEKIAIQIRTHLKLEKLRTLLSKHKSLHSDLIDFMGVGISETKQATDDRSMDEETNNSSSRSEKKFAHYKDTIKKSFDKSNTSSSASTGFQKSVVNPSAPKLSDREEPNREEGKEEEDLILATGLQHISLKHALQAMSDRFREHLPLEPRPMNWSDVVEAAYRLRTELFISQSSWARACETLGRTGAAVCVLLTDQATQREDDPVRLPAAYFNAMINRAKQGELRLHSSVFGLLGK